ncbi:MAG: hypothetical protein COS87_02880 [Chloroflexi bacterium CG07_land_8_20_14_0_80_45_17]|nr:MAG: hypothetical protein COS87_02880 [Chloroflexi bacterium CG07_land_8_20_14_0_80_45_17]
MKSLLQDLGESFYIAIFRRIPLHGNQFRAGERWDLKARLYLDFVNDEVIRYLIRMLESIDYPGLHFGSGIERGSEVLGDREQLTTWARDIFERVYRILQYLET